MGIAGLIAFAGVAGGEFAAPAAPRQPLTLGIVTDRARYHADDTIMIRAGFAGDPLARLQFGDAGGGAVHFHLLLRPLDGQGQPLCRPLWRLQFEEWAEKRDESPVWLAGVGCGLTRQLAVHLPRLSGLPAGRYELRVGYGLDADRLQPLVAAAAGGDVAVEAMLTTKLTGACEHPVLSAPVTITIRPPRRDP